MHTYSDILIQLLVISVISSAGKEMHMRIFFVGINETVILNCTCFHQSKSTWRVLKRSTEIRIDTSETEQRYIPYTQGLLLNPKLKNSNIDISGDYERGECNLIIRNFSAEDTGTYKCEYWVTDNACIDTYNLYLRSPPSDLKLQNTSDRDGKKILRGIEGTKLTVVCTEKSGKPEETLVLKTNGSSIQRGRDGRLEYSFVPTRKNNQQSFVCYAFSEILANPLVCTVELDILYKPDLVIHNINPRIFLEGHSTKLCCQAYGNPHVKTIEWKQNGESIVIGYDSYLCLEFTPLHRSDAGRYTCKATNIVGPSEVAMLYTVLYPPVIHISRKLVGQNITLTCNPSGEPNNYTFDDWEHRSEFKEYIRSVRGTQDGKLTILKAGNKNRRNENDGIYTCKSSNGIPDVQAELYQKGTVLINEQGPPIFVKANKPIQIGQYGQKINLSVFLYNSFGNIQTYISKQNKNLNIQSTEENIVTNDLFHNVNVTVKGIKISFQMVLEKAEDFKDYTIKACNQIGCNEYVVMIKSANYYSSKSLSYDSSCWLIMGSVLGGSLLFSICLNIYCFLKRKKKSRIMANIPLEVLYDEIGNISFTNANNQVVLNNAQELVTSTDSPVFEGANNNLSSSEKSSTSDSSVHSLSISLLNEDGYENPYQTVDLGNTEIHPYTTIWSNLYQNTTVFPSKIMTKYAKERDPWLIIYKKKYM